MSEHDRPESEADTHGHVAADPDTDWEAAYAGDVPSTPVDSDVVALARTLQPGTALDLGCGSGQNSIWLAQHGWQVHGVDIATSDKFDLVISTYALPPRGHGRTHALSVARDAVAPRGVALIAEFEVTLTAAGWMAGDNLVSLTEITQMFPGFDLERAEVKATSHSHGTDHKELPIAIVIARHPGPLSSRA